MSIRRLQRAIGRNGIASLDFGCVHSRRLQHRTSVSRGTGMRRSFGLSLRWLSHSVSGLALVTAAGLLAGRPALAQSCPSGAVICIDNSGAGGRNGKSAGNHNDNGENGQSGRDITTQIPSLGVASTIPGHERRSAAQQWRQGRRELGPPQPLGRQWRRRRRDHGHRTPDTADPLRPLLQPAWAGTDAGLARRQWRGDEHRHRRSQLWPGRSWRKADDGSDALQRNRYGAFPVGDHGGRLGLRRGGAASGCQREGRRRRARWRYRFDDISRHHHGSGTEHSRSCDRACLERRQWRRGPRQQRRSQL
jgi:hypothetical protein